MTLKATTTRCQLPRIHPAWQSTCQCMLRQLRPTSRRKTRTGMAGDAASVAGKREIQKLLQRLSSVRPFVFSRIAIRRALTNCTVSRDAICTVRR